MIKKPLIDPNVLQQLERLGPDELELFLLNRGNYRGALLSATRMINEMRVNHNYGVLETLICGHAYLAAGLISASLKGQDRVGIEMDCDGPAGGFVVDSSAGGSVRGYLRHAPIQIDAPPESFDTRPFIGDGTLSVTRFAEGSKQPFTGHISLAIHDYFHDFEAAEVGTREVRFDCGCSKERFARFLAAMPIDEIKEIREQGPFPLRTVCHNCNTTYEFSESEIERAYQMSR
ncbi:MAG: Hsp33 family molecular chaperone HslO [Spirochaeta sp.]|nr:Hsp33 family molecular chaperone HslO [Spirochaeta sp.]